MPCQSSVPQGIQSPITLHYSTSIIIHDYYGSTLLLSDLHCTKQQLWCAITVPLGSTEVALRNVSLYWLWRPPKRTLALTLYTFPLPASTVISLSSADCWLQCSVSSWPTTVTHTSQLLLLQTALSENTTVRAESCAITPVMFGASKGSEEGNKWVHNFAPYCKETVYHYVIIVELHGEWPRHWALESCKHHCVRTCANSGSRQRCNSWGKGYAFNSTLDNMPGPIHPMKFGCGALWDVKKSHFRHIFLLQLAIICNLGRWGGHWRVCEQVNWTL